MPTDLEFWLLANYQKKVYVLRECQSMIKFLPDSIKPECETDGLLPALEILTRLTLNVEQSEYLHWLTVRSYHVTYVYFMESETGIHALS